MLVILNKLAMRRLRCSLCQQAACPRNPLCSLLRVEQIEQLMGSAVLPVRGYQHGDNLTRQFCLQVDTMTTSKLKRSGTALVGIGFLTSYTAIGEADLNCRCDPVPLRWAQPPAIGCSSVCATARQTSPVSALVV